MRLKVCCMFRASASVIYFLVVGFAEKEWLEVGTTRLVLFAASWADFVRNLVVRWCFTRMVGFKTGKARKDVTMSNVSVHVGSSS